MGRNAARSAGTGLLDHLTRPLRTRISKASHTDGDASPTSHAPIDAPDGTNLHWSSAAAECRGATYRSVLHRRPHRSYVKSNSGVMAEQVQHVITNSVDLLLAESTGLDREFFIRRPRAMVAPAK